jgi:TonB family protein
MKEKLTSSVLAVAISVSPINLASQSAQHGSSQGDKSPTESSTEASTQERKPQKIYRIGGNVKAPRVISSSQPSLDQQQIKQQDVGKKVLKTGSTIVRIIVGEDGKVRSAQVLRSFNADLDTKAIDAVKQWKFEPAQKKGVPVAVELEVQVDFHLYK